MRQPRSDMERAMEELVNKDRREYLNPFEDPNEEEVNVRVNETNDE